MLKKLIARLERKVGFVTSEIRENSERVGFEIETHQGKKFLLAHTDMETRFKVSKYFVDVKNLEAAIPSVTEFQDGDVLHLDEIGQMELFSPIFKELALKYLDSSNACLATLSKVYDDEFMQKIRHRDDIVLVEISEDNREEMERYIDGLIRKAFETCALDTGIISAMRYLPSVDR